jgi:class 3 adenylate cyclase
MSVFKGDRPVLEWSVDRKRCRVGSQRVRPMATGEQHGVSRRLAAILAADVAGYSRLMGNDEIGTLRALKAHRRELVDPTIARHHGRIVKTTGDGMLVEFRSIVDAVACAVSVQRGMAGRNATVPDDRCIVFRIGINLGDILIDGDDIFGDGVNVAARLEGLVKGGEICVSRGVHDHLRHRGGMLFEDLGEQLVKNIAHPIRAFRLWVGEATSQQKVPIAEETAEVPELPSAPAEISELSADNEVALELALWDSVKEGSPAELESYLEQYPEGTFASLARTRLDAAALSPPSPATPTPEETAAEARFLELREGQQSARGASGLPRATFKWPLRRTRLSSPEVS